MKKKKWFLIESLYKGGEKSEGERLLDCLIVPGKWKNKGWSRGTVRGKGEVSRGGMSVRMDRRNWGGLSQGF